MKKLLRKTIIALAGIAVTVAAVAAPLPAQAYTVSKPEPGVTVRSYDMDEYLDRLLKKGQYEKYERFAKIADAESWSKHLDNQYNRQIYAGHGQYLLDALRVQAYRLGFDGGHDVFTLLHLSEEKAVVKVLHDEKRYIVELKPTTYGVWLVEAMYRIK